MRGHPDFRTSEESQKARAAALDFLRVRLADSRIDGIRWKSVLDENTTPECRMLDGLEWDYPGFEPRGHKVAFPGFPPIWYNCRSTVLPIYGPEF
jgi:hypothetical protein